MFDFITKWKERKQQRLALETARNADIGDVVLLCPKGKKRPKSYEIVGKSAEHHGTIVFSLKALHGKRTFNTVATNHELVF
jgi:hypothetical protein